MGRSFYRAVPAKMVEDFTRKNSFYHKASDRYYEVIRRGDRYFVRRHQIGYDGKETNVLEKDIHYVMGSGNHARTYIHRTAQNRLIQLPVGWYPEKGGFFAMSPGYERPNHLGFRREIGFDCMFCHNGYPDVPAGVNAFNAEAAFPSALPEGIDCQRCHGPGRAHVETAQKPGAAKAAIRNSIINPSRLSAEREMEVCMQCHLETTSFALPGALQRYDRGTFSYRPGEPMANYLLHFDHAPGSGHDDKFEIVNSAYRLRKSACFLKSGGALKCTTCHNPHDVPRGDKAVEHYTTVCLTCHETGLQPRMAAGRHPKGRDCQGCHMPRRRTDDVVHAVMTDHLIQRRKPARDLLAPLAERQEIEGKTSYQGEVVLYYPESLPPSPERDLYLAAAQVVQKSNLDSGIAKLAAAIDKYQPKQPEFSFELAQAYLARQRRDLAIRYFRRALELNPDFGPAIRSLGAVLMQEGQWEQALETLERAARTDPTDATTRHELGRIYQHYRRAGDAVASIREAIRLQPVFPDAYNSLGGILAETGDRSGAEAAFRTAINDQPDFFEAHTNLANLLAGNGDSAQAEYHFRTAIALNPEFVAARYNYGGFLASLGQFARAEEQIEAAVRLSPGLAEAREILGNLYARRGDWRRAMSEYREALRVRPDFARAQLGLGTALGATGDFHAASRELAKAAASSDPAVSQEALELLRTLPVGGK